LAAPAISQGLQQLRLASGSVAEAPEPVGSEAIILRRTPVPDIEKPTGGPVEQIPLVNGKAQPLM